LAQQTDRGLAQAFNLGLAQAHGDWILFLNADDFFVDDRPSPAWSPLCANTRMRMSSTPGRDYFSAKRSRPFPLAVSWAALVTWSMFRLYNFLPHQSAFTNRQYFARVGGFDESCSISVDYEHYLRGGKTSRRFLSRSWSVKMRWEA